MMSTTDTYFMTSFQSGIHACMEGIHWSGKISNMDRFTIVYPMLAGVLVKKVWLYSQVDLEIPSPAEWDSRL